MSAVQAGAWSFYISGLNCFDCVGSSAFVECKLGAQTAGPRRGRLQLFAAGIAGGLRRRARKSLCRSPKRRRNARRPSCLDLITLLRKEMASQPQLLAPLGFEITDQALIQAATA